MDPLKRPALTRKGAREDAFSDKEILREEAGRRAIVVVGIAVPIRVELDLAVVKVEVRSVIEANARIRIFVSARPRHRNSKAFLAGNEAQSRS